MMQNKASKIRSALAFGPSGFAVARSDGKTSKTAQSEIIQLSPQFFVDENFIRNFATSAIDVFLTVQREYKSYFPDPVPQRIITSLSQMYRGLILELCKSLKEIGELVTADLYANLDFVWNFCEVMFISSHPDFPVLPYLVDWVKINFDQTDEILPDVLDQLPDLEPETLENLWKLINSHVFHGATSEAARLLHNVKTNHKTSSVLDRQLVLMSELLFKKPEFNPDRDSITEFESLWTTWQDECQNRLDQRAFFGSEELTYICKILCGDATAFSEAALQHKISWYEYLVLTLNYQFPTIRPSSLKGYAKRTLEVLNLTDSLESRDLILLHAMDFNIVNVLKEIQSVWDNPWFALHFSDLVFAGGFPSAGGDTRVDYSSVTPLRNHFILDYGSTLMEHSSLWQMGVYYLEALPEKIGFPVIRECLQRKKFTTEIEAHKLIQVAERFGFEREISGICRQVCLDKLKWGRMQDGLLWAIKGGDGPLTTWIVDSILFDGDCQIEPSLLESLKNVIPCADRLLFLGGLCDFRKLMDKKEYRGAMSQLCVLIKNDLIPIRIAHKILLSVLELVESDVKLDPGQTSILMEFLHTKVGSGKMTKEEFSKLNKFLISTRSFEILKVFRERKARAQIG